MGAREGKQELEAELQSFLRGDGGSEVRRPHVDERPLQPPPQREHLRQHQQQALVREDSLEKLGLKVLVASDEYDQCLIDERNTVGPVLQPTFCSRALRSSFSLSRSLSLLFLSLSLPLFFFSLSLSFHSQ
jgi:hypothetical protein